MTKTQKKLLDRLKKNIKHAGLTPTEGDIIYKYLKAEEKAINEEEQIVKAKKKEAKKKQQREERAQSVEELNNILSTAQLEQWDDEKITEELNQWVEKEERSHQNLKKQ